MGETLAVVMVVAVCATLLIGYPVALTLAGVSLIFAGIGATTGVMDLSLLGALRSASSASWGTMCCSPFRSLSSWA